MNTESVILYVDFSKRVLQVVFNKEELTNLLNSMNENDEDVSYLEIPFDKVYQNDETHQLAFAQDVTGLN